MEETQVPFPRKGFLCCKKVREKKHSLGSLIGNLLVKKTSGGGANLYDDELVCIAPS